jgi:NAD+ kinase
MKLIIFGDEQHKLEALLRPYAHLFETANDPEYVFAFGGDGTLMRAERAFPGVPKILIRNSSVAKLAPQRPTEEILQLFFSGGFRITQHSKLALFVNDEQKGIALNDVVVHNENPRHAIRYSVRINDTLLYERVIGDGVVCATPLGSTGYYRSITDSCFETGIGLAFNNSTEQTDHIVLKEESVIHLGILRGPGICYVDNHEAFVPLTEGSRVRIEKADTNTSIIVVESDQHR